MARQRSTHRFRVLLHSRVEPSRSTNKNVTGRTEGHRGLHRLEVDPNTGIAQKKTAGTFTGKLTFPRQLR
jgi:hypothetical protein